MTVVWGKGKCCSSVFLGHRTYAKERTQTQYKKNVRFRSLSHCQDTLTHLLGNLWETEQVLVQQKNAIVRYTDPMRLEWPVNWFDENYFAKRIG